MARKKKKAATSVTQKSHPIMGGLLRRVLQDVDVLIAGDHWAEAHEALLTLDDAHPNTVDILLRLHVTSSELAELSTLEWADERLSRLSPPDPELALSRASAHLANGHPALTASVLTDFLRRWPEHEEALRVREVVSELGTITKALVNASASAGEMTIEDAANDELVDLYMSHGAFHLAEQVAEKLAAKLPHFLPALNNISICRLQAGDIKGAIQKAGEALSVAPDGVHALANMVRFHVMSGDPDSARAYAERLKASRQDAMRRELKVAEALSFIGDNEGVVQAYERAKKVKSLSELGSLFLHLTAVAHARLGKTAAANRLWKKALEDPDAEQVIRDNVEDSRKPVGERHGPWAFSKSNWISAAASLDARSVMSACAAESEHACERAVQRFLRKYPQIKRLAPLLLDLGDPSATSLVILLAGKSDSPEMLSALKEFAVGRHGSDALRATALQIVADAGYLSNEPVSFWRNGEAKSTRLYNWRITTEPHDVLPADVEPLAHEAALFLRAGDAEAALRLFEPIRQKYPDSPSVLNNTAAAYALAGRATEAMEIIEELHRTHPDYVFARTNLAAERAREGRIDEARELLEPVMNQRELHTSEFTAMTSALIAVEIADENPENARYWMGQLESVEPEHPYLKTAHKVVELLETKQLFGKILARKRRSRRKPNQDS